MHLEAEKRNGRSSVVAAYLFIACGQRISVRVVEECVISITPRKRLKWKRERTVINIWCYFPSPPTHTLFHPADQGSESPLAVSQCSILTFVRRRRWWYGMNGGCSCGWFACCSHTFSMQTPTPGSATTKDRIFQVRPTPQIGNSGKSRMKRMI